MQSCAFCNGDLTQLDALQEINPIKGTEDADIEEEVLARSGSAIEQMNTLMSKTTFASSKAMAVFMESKKSIWFPVDPTFSLQIALVKSLAGGLGSKLYWNQCLACLPDGVSECPKMDVVVKNLEALRGTKAWMVADAPTRGTVQSIIDIVMGMLRGAAPPSGSFPAGSGMVDVSTKLAIFCEEGVEKSKVRGAKALEVRIQRLKELVETKKLNDLQPVFDCEPYAWLLKKSELQTLRDLCLKGRELVVAAPIAAESASSSMARMVAIHDADKAKGQADATTVSKVAKKRKK